MFVLIHCRIVVYCCLFVVSAVDCTWESAGHHVSMLGVECMHIMGGGGGGAGGTTGSRREESMQTYTFCVLQTFHRLCKTSDSEGSLEMEGGRWRGCGGGQVN